MTAPDPLFRSSTLEHEVSLPVLGIETHFDSNNEEILSLVEQSFGRWRQLATAAHSTSAPVRIRIVVNEGGDATPDHSRIEYTSGPEARLRIQAHGSIAYVDPVRRQSVAYVTSSLVDDHDNFRVAILEAMTFALLACFDRHPLHAAAITRGDRTALLAGPAGSGKSTLAYLAYSAGIRVLSDDHVWLQLAPDCCVWASAPHARLRAESATHFPDLEHPGSDKHAVALASRDDDHSLVARGPVVCILARDARASLVRLQPSEIEMELVTQLAPGFDRFPERNHEVFSTIASNGGWRLTLSDNPHDALPLLYRVLDGT